MNNFDFGYNPVNVTSVPNVGTWLFCKDEDLVKEVDNFNDAWSICYFVMPKSAKLYVDGVLWLDEEELLTAYPRNLLMEDWMYTCTDAEIAMVLFDRVGNPKFNTIPF